MDSASQDKWCRVWSVEELRENAENWSLAGDVALLNTIRAFSEKLLNKTGEISEKIDTLLNNIDEAGLKLDLAQNEFQNLKNTQFIESRVYDDDETLDSKEEEKVVEVPISEDEQEKLVIKSIKMGMEILDEYYDRLEVSVSDSEEETDKSQSCEYILKPKDMYAHRPLPPVIGTDEWYKKWHLDILSSDSESDKVSDVYSESDSEDNLPKGLVKGSETSSELDFSSHASETRPVASSTFNSSQHVDLESSSSENEEQESQLEKTPLANKSFAEQLAAKLGNIISEQEPEEINKRPIQPARTKNAVGIPFVEEPPPLDEFEHAILPKNIQTGYFSGGQGLFDDNDEDELFWGQPNKTSEVPNVKESKQHSTLKVNKGLFDESSSDEDDILASSKKTAYNNSKYLPSKHSVGFYNEEPPEFQDRKKTQYDEPDKKPIGGVRLVGSSDMFNDQKISKILKSSVQETNEKVETSSVTEPIQKDISSRPKRKTLFDDDDFDDFLSVENSVSITSEAQKKGEQQRKVNLFDDLISDDTYVTDRKDTKSSSIHTTTFENKKPNLFDDHDDDDNDKILNPSKKISLFDDDDELFNEDEDFFSSITKTKLNSKLFEDLDEQKSDGMFNIKNKSDGPKKDVFSDENGSVVEDTKNHVAKSLLPSDETQATENFKIENKLNNLNTTNENVEIKIEEKEHNARNKFNMKKGMNESEEASTKQNTNDAAVKKTLSLFDDSDVEDDDIFGGKIKSEFDKLISQESEIEGINKEFQNTGNQVNKVSGTQLENEYFSDNRVQPEIAVPPPSITVQDPSPSQLTEKLTDFPISPFDSVPPPDDCENWDTKSDSLSDVEEFVPFRLDENYSRSSVFYDEPPSLDPNESSGIVKDYSSNRTETDDSSFIPPASSSRRFSSEIFSEQQSQDSLFVTKNKTESVNPVSLDVIPELGQSDVTDITPSGDIENLYSSDVTPSGNLKNSTTVPESSEKQRISSSNNQQENSPVKEDMLPNRHTSSENVLNRIASIEKNLQTDRDHKPTVEPKTSPGKLKHNLNINVNALRPTLGPPKLRPLPKSQSLPNDEIDNVMSASQRNMPSSEHNKSFEGNEQKVEVLSSITKDRVKIPVKRRPSTRKGRLEAIRRSAADLPFHEETYTPEPENYVDIPSLEDKKAVKPSGLGDGYNGSSNSTDDTELDVNLITNDSINNSVANKLGETVVTTSISRNTGGFFDSSLSDNELFTESPKKVEKYSNFIGIIQPSNIEIPPKEEQQISTSTRKITRLFGDGDEISFSDKKMGNIKESLSRVENNIIDKISTKLFSDSDEEFLSNFTLDKTQEKSTSEHDISNTKKNPNVFSESDDEIFTTGKVVKVNEKLGETMRDQNVKKLTHISGETDEGLASPILVETVEKNTKDETQFSVENKKTTKVFSETDEELFPSVSRKITKKKTTQLFGSDDDSEDDLFKNSSRKVVGGKSGGPASNTFLKKPLDHPQKSLFGDSSSDDDLFSGSGKSGKQGRRSRDPTIKTQKLQGSKTSEDPLSKLL